MRVAAALRASATRAFSTATSASALGPLAAEAMGAEAAAAWAWRSICAALAWASCITFSAERLALSTASLAAASFLRYSSSLPTSTRILLLSRAFSLYSVT